MVVAQLAERPILTPEDAGLNPGIGNNIYLLEKVTKINENCHLVSKKISILDFLLTRNVFEKLL